MAAGNAPVDPVDVPEAGGPAAGGGGRIPAPRECYICLLKKIPRQYMVVMPCGHAACSNCVAKLDKLSCGLCRAEVKTTVCALEDEKDRGFVADMAEAGIATTVFDWGYYRASLADVAYCKDYRGAIEIMKQNNAKPSLPPLQGMHNSGRSGFRHLTLRTCIFGEMSFSDVPEDADSHAADALEYASDFYSLAELTSSHVRTAVLRMTRDTGSHFMVRSWANFMLKLKTPREQEEFLLDLICNRWKRCADLTKNRNFVGAVVTLPTAGGIFDNPVRAKVFLGAVLMLSPLPNQEWIIAALRSRGALDKIKAEDLGAVNAFNRLWAHPSTPPLNVEWVTAVAVRTGNVDYVKRVLDSDGASLAYVRIMHDSTMDNELSSAWTFVLFRHWMTLDADKRRQVASETGMRWWVESTDFTELLENSRGNNGRWRRAEAACRRELVSKDYFRGLGEGVEGITSMLELAKTSSLMGKLKTLVRRTKVAEVFNFADHLEGKTHQDFKTSRPRKRSTGNKRERDDDTAKYFAFDPAAGGGAAAAGGGAAAAAMAEFARQKEVLEGAVAAAESALLRAKRRREEVAAAAAAAAAAEGDPAE